MKLLPRKPINAADNLGRGMDFALVTLVFLGLGALLDRWLGTRPLFMIGLVVFSMIGQFIRMWFEYDATMRQLEDERRAGASAHTRAKSG